MSVSPYERNELFRGQPLRPSQVRDTVRRISPGYGGQFYGGNQFYGNQFDQWGNPLYLGNQQQFIQRPLYSGGGGNYGYSSGYGSGFSSGYGGGNYGYDQWSTQYAPTMRAERFIQRPVAYDTSSRFYQAPLQSQFIRRSYLPEITHVHQPEVIREVVEENRPLIREVVHVQHRPITVKDVFLKEPAPALPPLEKRRVAPPELMREVVHEVKPVIREVVHHERRPVIVREKYAVERQPEIRHFSETLMHKHLPGENILTEPVANMATAGCYEIVGELYGQPMTSSSMSTQPISSQ